MKLMLNTLIVCDKANRIRTIIELFEKQAGIALEITAASVAELMQNQELSSYDALIIDSELAEPLQEWLQEKRKQLKLKVLYDDKETEKINVPIRAFDAVIYTGMPAERLREVFVRSLSAKGIQMPVQEPSWNYSLRQNTSPGSTIGIATISGLSIINVAEIIRCESSDSYTNIYLMNGDRIIASKPLKEYERKLKDHSFLRLHRRHLVNVSYIKEYVRGRGGQILLNDGTSIEVSTRKKGVFMNYMKHMRI